MVDNFDLVAKYLRDLELTETISGQRTDGDVWYVQLLRRQSDDPMINGVPDPAYHGNMHSRSLKDYLIHSADHLLELKNEMVALCKVQNVRAYIRLNKRTYRGIAIEALDMLVKQLKSDTFGSPYHMIASANGSVNNAGDHKTWVVDLDKEYIPFESDIVNMICACEPHRSNIETLQNLSAITFEEAKKHHIEKNFFTLPTKSGKHIIVRPFNLAAFGRSWQTYVLENKITAPLPQVKKENADPDPMYHFSLTGMYLKHADDFANLAKGVCNDVTVDIIDKNKTIIHVSKLDFDDFKQLWHQHCLSKGIWMKQMDIHHDNPTILYVP